ncbi:MAG: MFS transporter [Alphaproteobacteria bacterium]|nr:MFS transporter [Alphaproteobacteria bacterium]
MQSTRTKLIYGAGSIAFGVNDQSFSYILPFFFNQVVGLPAIWVGSAVAFAMAFDALADPVVGQVSDNLRTPLGRRHPFMYAAAIPVALSYLLLWNPPHWSIRAIFYYLIVFAILVRTFITLYEIPSSSLVAELTPDYHQRTSFFAYRNLFAWLGGLSMQLLCYGVFFAADKTHPIGQLNPKGYVTYSITGAVVIATVILLSAAGTHRFIPHFAKPKPRQMTALTTLREMWETVRHQSFLVLVISALFSSIAAGTLAALNIYFNTFFWGLNSEQIFLLTAVLVPGAVAAWAIAPAVSRWLGKKAALISLWIIAQCFYWFPLGARILGFFPQNGSPLLVPLLLVFGTVGVTLSITNDIVFNSMLADVVEDSELRTGRRSEGLFFAARSLVTKAVSGVGGLVAGVLLVLAHFPAHANPATLDPAIPKTLALYYFPIVFGLYAVALVCVGFYRIDRATHEENLRRLGRSP